MNDPTNTSVNSTKLPTAFYDVNILHMYPNTNLYGYIDTDIIAKRKELLNTNLYGYIDTDIIAKRKELLNTTYGIVTKSSTAFCNAPHRIRESIVGQINFWCTYCTWRHNPITYNIAHERVNVELSEYAAYNPYC